ncbi:gluconate transporter [Hymenobacter taeanensis]|uniref:Gluconate transporter n=1 Tax=Hymenobacter taeanensis TaxID=2735321 RepID=A0A6M6BJ18_9BACT|nr:MULTISPECIES: gluconate:H+ symporter [Hymenobacter]QJX48086.1 gluconate transporter [Hymenobacter taeanensis]UOQ82452.1 gluconate:H+ symporter [Hymenobacter sp. 5414T-23]
MTLLIVLLAVLALIGLISWGKVNAFLAFLLVTLGTGLALGLTGGELMGAISKGLGDTLGSVLIVIVLGAMLGKIVADSGAAQQIAAVLIEVFGTRYIQWTMMITGFIIGIPLFYNVGFVLMIPLIFSVVYKYRLPAVYVGLPMLAALSVMHGFLPPHPSPTALVAQFQASIGLTFLYGLLIAIPAVILAGPVYGLTLRGIVSVPLASFVSETLPENALPGRVNSFISSLLPVLLLAVVLGLQALLPPGGPLSPALTFLAEPSVVMLASLLVATFTLGTGLGRPMSSVMDAYASSVKDVALILLIIGGAGALKEVLVASGVSHEIAQSLQHTGLPPLLLGWLIAAAIRVCLGSATIAGLTAAGVMLPTMALSHTNPNLMVLSIGAGSLLLSHFNDAGFWLFKEYFNLSAKDTLRSWTMMETIVSVVGLGGVLLLDWALPLLGH